MKGQRWKHIVVEEKRRKKKMWLFLRKWRLFIGEGGLKKRVGSHNYSQKTCKNTFFDFTTVQKRLKNALFVVQTTGQNFWCSPNYIIRITHGFRITYFGNIRLWRGPKGNLGLCKWWVLVRILESGLLQHWILFCGPNCTDNFCGPQRLDTCINRGPCFHYK